MHHKKGGENLRLFINKKRTAIFLLTVLVFCLPIQSFAKERKHDDDVIRYVALGDSLAAGQTPYHTIGLSYANFIADYYKKEHVTVKLFNEGVSGFTSEQLKQSILLNQAEQMEIRNANIITVDIGANDLLGVLTTNPSQVPQAIQNVGSNLYVILSTIRQLNRHAHVYVMGYYNPFPYLPSDQQASLLSMLNGLNQTIQSTAKVNQASFVPTEKAIAKNPYLYIPNPLDIHLSLAGYQTVANEFWKYIDRD